MYGLRDLLVTKDVKETNSSLVARRYAAPSPVPTQLGPGGICFDFNDGCRVLLPETDHPWRVRLLDVDSGNVLFDAEVKSGLVQSGKRYFVRFGIEIRQCGEVVLAHSYSAAGRNVLIQFPRSGVLGDTIGWFPYAVRFGRKHSCYLTCAMTEKMAALFRDEYPDVTFTTHDEVHPSDYYATYSLGLFFDDVHLVHQPCDFRRVGLHRTAGYILGVDPAESAPRVSILDRSRPIDEPYVAIATQSTRQAKYWNNPDGWHEVIDFLRAAGYRVICIDQKRSHGVGLFWNHIPNGAEDQTGDRPLAERARWLVNAEFFVGLASGLSWLAWATKVPVVMISGFSHPLTEFYTPYRVINWHACNSCWDDPRLLHDRNDFLGCPRHRDTERQFECTRLITAEQVKATIRQIPGFKG
jgi:autotransporter strand-loop-strand O-heptosyltransferase